MIALSSSLPLIKISPDNLATCDTEWLRRNVRDAAVRAEVPEWFADDVVSGVITFLKNHYQGTTITIDVAQGSHGKHLTTPGGRKFPGSVRRQSLDGAVEYLQTAGCAQE